MAVAITGLVGSALAPAAAKGKKRPPAPLPGWVVDRVTFEPLDDSPLRVGEARYRGWFEFTRPRGAGLAAVNHVSFEDYLKGVSEVPTSWPSEAQKAQAIAARTFALHEMGRKVATPYRAAGADICATQACQVYEGLDKELRPGGQAWTAAVEATRGQILAHKGGPILAMYSSSNGGRTVSGGKPYLRAVDDPDDRHSPLHRWRSGYSLAAVGRALGGPPPAEVRRSGDEMVVAVVDGEGNAAERRLPVEEFRTKLNGSLAAPEGLPLPVPSNRFAAHTAEGAVVIEGRGWGHGIGMSQHGALGKATRGLKAADILAAYYGGLRPTTLPPERLPPQVRVAVVVDAARAVLGSDAGSFRVTDGNGGVIAHAGHGRWSIAPGPRGRGVRVVPPAEQAGPPTADVAATDPAPPLPGRPLAVQLRLAGPPAVTQVHLIAPDGTTSNAVTAALRAEGDLVVPVSAAASGGLYTLVVERDAGAGRTTSSPLVVNVDPALAPPPELASVPTRVGLSSATPAGAVEAAAGSLLFGVAGLVLTLRRRLSRATKLH